jgi:hypothetical protein
MSVSLTLRAVEIFRSSGVPVTFEPGWDTRGNDQSSAYQGGIVHHTGGAYNATCPGILIFGRSDLSGPLCNFAGLSGGGIHVVAAHPANHAGASGGPSNGPFPRTTLFNRLVMGLEICYPGSSPMTDPQYRTAKVFGHAMKALFGDIERARGHAETSVEGKWDPGYSPGRTISMSGFRPDALNLQEGDDDMTPDEYNNQVLYKRYGDRNLVDMWAEQTNRSVAIDDKLAQAVGLLERVAIRLDGLALGGGSVDVAALADAVEDEADRRDRDGDPSTGQPS